MSTKSMAHPRPSLLRVVLCVVLAAACDSAPGPTAPAPTSPSPSPAPAPTPEPGEYRVSGVVRDAADGAPIASATVVLRYGPGSQLMMSTGADGAYAFSFRTNQPYRNEFGVVFGEFLGLLAVRDGAYWGDIGRGHWTAVQSLPWGTPEVAHDVRLRPVTTLTAGQSMRVWVDADSSLEWNPEYDPWTFARFDTLVEEFRVSVQTGGFLTIAAVPEAGGNVAMLTCGYEGCPATLVQGSVSFAVKAGASPLYFRVEIPRTSAPQRYEIQTSLR